MQAAREARSQRGTGTPGASADLVYLYDPSANRIMHTNVFTDDFMTYLQNIPTDICSSIGYTRLVSMNVLKETDEGAVRISLSSPLSALSSGGAGATTSMRDMGLSSYPVMLNEGAPSYVEKNYDLLSGEYPKSATDIVLVLDDYNCIDYNVMVNMGFIQKNDDGSFPASMNFDDIVGTELKIIPNNNYYTETDYGTYLPNNDLNAVYNMDGNITVRICGIVKQKADVQIGLLATGFAYSDDLSQMVIDSAMDSDIVAAQKLSNKNVMTNMDIDDATKQMTLASLGGDATPYMIMVYPTDFSSKDKVTAYLDAYNAGKDDADKIVYTDLAATLSNLTGGIMDAITIVLIAFAGISLVVSLIMIGIITYTSVIERTKEIGILKALGARKKDITRVFDAETCILGVFSGVLGVAIAYLLTLPINMIIYKMTNLKGVANLPFFYAVLLIVISAALTMLGGHIPARIASKKDAVEALRAE